MTEINNAAFNIIIVRAINAETPETKRRAVNEALALLYSTDTLKKWAQSIAKSRGYRDPSGVHDLEQVIAEKLLLSLRDATVESHDRVTDWLRFMYGLAVNAVKDYLASSQVTVASKMSGVMKRRDIIARTTKELLAKTGRDPNRHEIITAANEWATAHHKDARKQGLLITEEDFATAGMRPVSLDETPLAGQVVENEAETTSETQLALRRLRDAAGELYPEDANLMLVIAAWAQCIADAERPSQANISAATGLSPAHVRTGLARLNDVLDQVRDLFG